MDIYLSAFLTGFFLAFLISMDSILISDLGRFLGFRVEQAQVFFGKLMTRSMGRVIWKLGWLPLGSSVKISGLLREEGQPIHPGDFDQQPLFKRFLLLFVDKFFIGLVLLLALFLMPTESIAAGFDLVLDFYLHILKAPAENGGAFADVGSPAFVLAYVALWVLVTALVPVGGNKTQLFLSDLLGIRPTAEKQGGMWFAMLSGLLFAAGLFYLVYRIFRYVNAAYPDQALAIWACFFGGLIALHLPWVVVLKVLGKPVVKRPPQEGHES